MALNIPRSKYTHADYTPEPDPDPADKKTSLEDGLDKFLGRDSSTTTDSVGSIGGDRDRSGLPKPFLPSQPKPAPPAITIVKSRDESVTYLFLGALALLFFMQPRTHCNCHYQNQNDD